MTNEEAIHIIDVAFGVPQAVRRFGEDRTYHEAEIREAKDMAIKALSCSENPSYNSIKTELDVISRRMTLDLCERFGGCVPYSVLSSHDMLPAVSTEKTGRWEKIKSGDKTFPEIIVCSRCGGENSYISEWDRNNNPLSKSFRTTKYCPNCGAKMVEPQESEVQDADND